MTEPLPNNYFLVEDVAKRFPQYAGLVSTDPQWCPPKIKYDGKEYFEEWSFKSYMKFIQKNSPKGLGKNSRIISSK